MRKYLYFISADADHLQTRLERLAKKGLELTDTRGLFTGEFEVTRRADLRYLVLPFGAEKNFPRTADFTSFGWQLMGGFNGMGIFKSLPCVEPDTEGLIKKLEADDCIHPDRHSVPASIVLLLALTVLLFWWMGRSGAWYLSYTGICERVLFVVTLALAAANLVTLRTYPSAWVHGLTIPVLVGEMYFAVVLSQLDRTDQPVYFAVLLLILALACGASLWHKARMLGVALGGICLVVLCLGLIFPLSTRLDAAGSLRGDAAGDQIVTLADLGYEEAVKGASLEHNGTFLVRRTTYWEYSGEGQISSVVYSSLSSALAGDVVERQLRSGSWEEMEDGWRSADREKLLLRFGRTVVLVTGDRPIPEEQVDIIFEKLF